MDVPPDLHLRSVLLVEDDRVTNAALARYLARRVGRVDTAFNGEEGLAKYEANPCDIVITDVRMPHIDGLTMAGALKLRRPGLPIIIVTAHNEVDYLLRAIDMHLDGYIIKPVDPGKLLAALHRAAAAYNRGAGQSQLRAHSLTATVQLVQRIILILESWVGEIPNHASRVARLAKAMAIQLDIEEEQQQVLQLAALLRDVDLLTQRDSPVWTAGRLTPAEWVQMQQHHEATTIDFPEDDIFRTHVAPSCGYIMRGRMAAAIPRG